MTPHERAALLRADLDAVPSRWAPGARDEAEDVLAYYTGAVLALVLFTAPVFNAKDAGQPEG